MTALLALIRKDLLLYLSDRRAWTLNLVMPIVLGAFFGYLFGGSGVANNARITVGLAMQDTSVIGRQIADALRTDAALGVSAVTLEQAQEQVRSGKLDVAIVIPGGFGDAAGTALFSRHKKPELWIYYDPSQAAVLAMVKGILTQHVMQTVTAEMFSGEAGRKLVDDSFRQLEQKAGTDASLASLRDFLGSVKTFRDRQAASAGDGLSADPKAGLSMPYETRDQAMSSGPKYNGYGHSFGGMGVQFILFMGIDIGIGILVARREGIWQRLLAAPITISTVLLARAISGAVIAFCLLCLIFAFAVLVFHVEVAGSLPGFLGITLCFSLMAASFGLLIAAFGKTPEAARGIAVFATLIMVMLGGAWVPSFIFPQWLQKLSLIVPTRWAVDGLDAMTWRGLGMQAALAPMAVLLGFTFGFGMLAFYKFRRDGQHGV